MSRPSDRHVEFIVLGAGFSGLCTAMRLQSSGRSSFLVLEKSSGLGGTWWHNSYPGVECDVPSHLYSLSFAPKANWSKRYAGGAEIQAYMVECAEKAGILDRFLFSQNVVECRWSGRTWKVRTAAGDCYESRFLVSGLGGLHTPKLPSLEGLDGFAGAMFHTSSWRHDVELAGRRVGMIGTGATAVQAAPHVAREAGEFYLFQRTPTWVGPKDDRLYSEVEVEAFTELPQRLRQYRWKIWRNFETGGLDTYRRGSAMNSALEQAARHNLWNTVADADVADALTPRFNYSCKRPTISNDYYPMFNRANVELVTTGVRRVLADGVELDDGRVVELDALILATGYQSFDITAQVDFYGSEGQLLGDMWKSRITSYRSVMVNGFPNLFLVLGPNSAGRTSLLQAIEAGVDFVIRCLDRLAEEGGHSIEPTEAAVRGFTEFIDERYEQFPLDSDCVSWWTRNGENHALYPGASIDYRLMLMDIGAGDLVVEY